MPKFRFKLESVLGVKEAVEAQKQRAFAEAQRRVIEKEEARQRCLEEVRRTIVALRRITESHLDIKEVLSHQRYINSLRVATARIDAELPPLRAEMEKRRLELVEASKERKALEKLKVRQFEEWRKEQDRIEQKSLDEMGLNSFRAKRKQVAGAKGAETVEDEVAISGETQEEAGRSDAPGKGDRGAGPDRD
ncbi:MAG: flagellar export protein FliJ [Planctomycetes bacterium]|nr:flagellar export protein FliJ [Planctomycetota bacterium]